MGLALLTLGGCDLPSMPSWETENRLSIDVLPIETESLIPGALEDEGERWGIRAVTQSQTYKARKAASEQPGSSPGAPSSTWQESIPVPIGEGIKAVEDLSGTVEVTLEPDGDSWFPNDSAVVAVEILNGNGDRLTHEERGGAGTLELDIKAVEVDSALTVAWTLDVNEEVDESGTIRVDIETRDVSGKRVRLPAFADDVGPHTTDIGLEGSQGSAAEMETLTLRARSEASLPLEGHAVFEAAGETREMTLEDGDGIKFVLEGRELDQVIESGNLPMTVHGPVALPEDTWIAPDVSAAIHVETYANHKVEP